MKKFLLSLGILLCCAVASNAQAEYPDVPFSDSAYADINSLSKAGIFDTGIFDNCYGSVGPRAMTRYEFAVAIARLLENLPLDSKDGTFKEFKSPPEVPSLNKPEVMSTLKRLAEKFLPELEAFNIDVRKIKINGVFLIEPKITQPKIKIAPPFSDVPKNHWAFESVEKLRLSGIVIGSSN